MYNYSTETIYLLGSSGSNTFPLVKVVADTKGIKVFGLSENHKDQYAHAEKYAEDEFGRIDKSHGHLHFRDKRAAESWQDEAYRTAGARPGIRGGCSVTPPLDDLDGYLPIITLGFSIPEIVRNPVKQKHYRNYHLTVNLDEYKSNFLSVEVLLRGQGSKKLFSDFEPSNIWENVIFDKKEPHIIFSIKK